MTPPRYIIRGWVRKGRIRWLLYQTGPVCLYCRVDLNRRADDPRQLTLDHWVPKSQGGSNRVRNLVLACATCNRRKGDKPAEVYLTSQQLAGRILAVEQEAQCSSVDEMTSTKR